MSIVNTCKIPDLSGTNTVNTTPLTSTTSLSSTTTSINYHLPAIVNPSTPIPACNINNSNNSNCSNSNNNNSLPVSTSTNSTVVTSHQSSKQIYNSTTLKLLNRLLEEASQTGDLNLNNKNLHEFPSRLAINYDLTDTITADLSKNHLTELPKDICQYDSLEKLTLYSNLIRSIPEISVNQLKCLKILDLNSNNLSYLPSSLCNLGSLQVLTVNNNRLVSLPEEIGRLEKLIQLDVSCNEITHLPSQIGEMTSLRALNVRRNLLVELPKEIAQLKLVNFDCSSNRLSKLPLCFREMVSLIDLVVDHNPLEVPPAHICTKGLLHIMKYLLVEAVKEEKKRGILSEYEISSQYNSQRLCNGPIGGGGGLTFSSYMFQSSVRNMCKKLNGTSSSSMSTVSSSSSSSSTSSTSSSSSLKKLKQQQHHQLSPPFPPVPTSTSTITTNLSNGSISPTSSSSSPINNNNNTKDIEIESYEPSSSSSSSTSSSPQINLINKSAKTEPLPSHPKSMSIHELISLKSTNANATTTNITNNSNAFSSTSLNNINATQKSYINKYSNSSNYDLEFNAQQQVWHLNDEKNNNYNINSTNNNNNKSKQLVSHQQLQNFDNNFSIISGLSLNSNSTIITSTTNNSKLQTINSFNNSNNNNNKQLINKQRLTTNNDSLITDKTTNSSYVYTNNNTSMLQRNISNSNIQATDGISNGNTTSTNGVFNSNHHSHHHLKPTHLSHQQQQQQQQQQQPILSTSSNTVKMKGQSDLINYGIIPGVNGSSSPSSTSSSSSGGPLSEPQNTNSYNISSQTTSQLNKQPSYPVNNYNHDQLEDEIDNSYRLVTTSNKTASLSLPNDEMHLNPNLENACFMINNGLTTPNNDGDKFYAKYQPSQPQQQQIWVPREESLQTQINLLHGKEINIETDININPAFTIRRHFIQIQEEQKLIDSLKKSIEAKLKIQLPSANSVEEMGVSLADGVVLCHLMNQIFPRAVQIIHVPSMAMPKLSLAKCRKNVENFIEACRRLGVPENDLCCPQDIIEAKNTVKVARTVMMLINYSQYFLQQHHQQEIDYRHAIINTNNITTIGNAMNMGHNTANSQQTQTPQQQTAV